MDMEKQIVLTANEGATSRCAETLKRIGRYAAMPQQMLRRYYSKVLGEDVSEARARAITEAQIAFFAVTLPADYPLVLRILACVWFVVKVRKLKNSPLPASPRGGECRRK